MGLKEEILAADDLAREEVTAWGKTFYLRTMTGWERERYEVGTLGAEGQQDFGRLRARVIVFCAVDGEGQRIFDEEDIDPLAKKSGRELRRLALIAHRLNAMAAEDLEAAEKK